MKPRAFILAWMSAIVLAGDACAHNPVKGIGTFYNGMLHPYLVPAHLLALLALGLMLGQYAPVSSKYALPAFVTALLCSVASIAFLPVSSMDILLLVVALVSGMLVAIAIAPGPVFPIVLAVMAGVVLGLSSPPDGVPSGQTWLALLGTALGASLMVIYAGGISAWLSRFQTWPRIAVRVLGSWIAASAFLVLVLEIAKSRGAA
jgi:hydrogenase/urease accessory protein HupE